MFPVYYIFNFLLSVLLILHIIWFYYTCKVAFKVIFSFEIMFAINFTDSL